LAFTFLKLLANEIYIRRIDLVLETQKFKDKMLKWFNSKGSSSPQLQQMTFDCNVPSTFKNKIVWRHSKMV
jgi:hypothetical protein